MSTIADSCTAVATWPDAWLVTATRADEPNEAALQALVIRHGPALRRQCRRLTGDTERANDLAQDTWCRFLRVRRSVQPEGSFPAFLAAVATNLWRDQRRAARRAGSLADERLLSLDGSLQDDEGNAPMPTYSLPHPPRFAEEDMLGLDIDLAAALGHLSPTLREVVVARYLHGESSVEIGRRFGRTQQTITSWLREARAQLEQHLADWRSAA